MTALAAPTVSIAGVTKSYRGITALDDVDIELSPGLTGLLGPNGAGKSTLLRIVATAIKPDAGRVSLLGHDVAGSTSAAVAERTEVRRSLGYLPQELGFASDMTAFSFVDYLAVLKEWDECQARHAEVRRVLALVGLEGQATRRIRVLSGGQKRRVALAQALLGDPHLMVLDEPTTGLDPEQRASLRKTLSALGQRSTVLLATHQTEDVAALCERVVVLYEGKVRYDGRVTNLVATAADRVWVADEWASGALTSYRTGSGRFRAVGGTRPPRGDATEPTLEDAYLLLLGADALRDVDAVA